MERYYKYGSRSFLREAACNKNPAIKIYISLVLMVQYCPSVTLCGVTFSPSREGVGVVVPPLSIHPYLLRLGSSIDPPRRGKLSLYTSPPVFPPLSPRPAPKPPRVGRHSHVTTGTGSGRQFADRLIARPETAKYKIFDSNRYRAPCCCRVRLLGETQLLPAPTTLPLTRATTVSEKRHG